MERPIYVPMFEDMLLALDCLDDGQLRKALDMIRAYYFDGQEPSEERSPARAMFLGFKASLDKTLARANANSANAKRRSKPRAKATGEQSEPEPSKPSRSQILANANKRQAKPSETERTEANGKRNRAKKASEQPANANETEPNETKPSQTEPNETKMDKTKDQRPKTKDQQKVKSVAHTPKTPPPLPKFTPPRTDEELEAMVSEAQAYGDQYLQGKGLDCSWDAWRWANHFASNGWLVSGRAHMRDWKASVRNWIGNDHPELGGGGKADDWAGKYVPEAIVVD